MNKVKNSKIKFKVLLVILATALISGAALQSSFAMQDDRDMYANLKESSNNVGSIHGTETETSELFLGVTDENKDNTYRTEVEDKELYANKFKTKANESGNASKANQSGASSNNAITALNTDKNEIILNEAENGVDSTDNNVDSSNMYSNLKETENSSNVNKAQGTETENGEISFGVTEKNKENPYNTEVEQNEIYEIKPSNSKNANNNNLNTGSQINPNFTITFDDSTNKTLNDKNTIQGNPNMTINIDGDEIEKHKYVDSYNIGGDVTRNQNTENDTSLLSDYDSHIASLMSDMFLGFGNVFEFLSKRNFEREVRAAFPGGVCAVYEHVNSYVLLAADMFLGRLDKYMDSNGRVGKFDCTINPALNPTYPKMEQYFLKVKDKFFEYLNVKLNILRRFGYDAEFNKKSCCINFIEFVYKAARSAFFKTVRKVISKLSDSSFIKNYMNQLKKDYISKTAGKYSEQKVRELPYYKAVFGKKILDLETFLHDLLVKALRDENIQIGQPLDLTPYAYKSVDIIKYNLKTMGSEENMNKPVFIPYLHKSILDFLKDSIKEQPNLDNSSLNLVKYYVMKDYGAMTTNALKELVKACDTCFNYLYEIMLLHFNYAMAKLF